MSGTADKDDLINIKLDGDTIAAVATGAPDAVIVDRLGNRKRPLSALGTADGAVPIDGNVTKRDTLTLTSPAVVPAGTDSGHTVNLAQMLAAVSAGRVPPLAAVKVAVSSVTLATPGATLDGVSMSNGDRFAYLDPAGGTNAAYGIYVFNGAATLATRATDANSAAELGLASFLVQDGVSNSKGATYQCQQRAADITSLGTTPLSFSNVANLGDPLAVLAALFNIVTGKFYDDKDVTVTVAGPSGTFAISVTVDGMVYIPNLNDGIHTRDTILFQKGQAVHFTVAGPNGMYAIDVDERGETYIANMSTTLAEAGLIPRKRVEMPGDSTVQGTPGNTPLPDQLQDLLGDDWDVVNSGEGGQSPHQIAVRARALIVPVRVSGKVLNVGPNTITHINGVAVAGEASGTRPSPDFQWRSSPATDFTGFPPDGATLGSIHGNVDNTATGGAPSTAEDYTFTPDDAEAAHLPVTIPDDTPLILDRTGLETSVMVPRVGINQIHDAGGLDALKVMVSALDTAQRRYILCTIANGLYPSELAGQSDYALINTYNAGMLQFAPYNTLDLRRIAIDKGLAMLAMTPDAFDIMDKANDTLPGQLRSVFATGTGPPFNSSVTTFALTVSTGAIGVGQILQIGTERILINGVSGSSVTSCTRGYLGTTAASHTSGAAFKTIDPRHENTACLGLYAQIIADFMTKKGWRK